MVWVYVLYFHRRMVLAEIEAGTMGEADKIISTLIGDKIEKRADIGCYPAHLFPKQRLEDFLANFCSH